MISLRPFPGQLRTAATVIAVVGSVLIGALAIAQELTPGSKPQPSVSDVSGLLDRPLAEIFAKFGAPYGFGVRDSNSDSPSVDILYRNFGFKVNNKIVKTCQFYRGWSGPVYGVTLGDDADGIVKAMGAPHMDTTQTDGSGVMVWETKDSKTQIYITFNKEGKSVGLNYELK